MTFPQQHSSSVRWKIFIKFVIVSRDPEQIQPAIYVEPVGGKKKKKKKKKEEKNPPLVLTFLSFYARNILV